MPIEILSLDDARTVEVLVPESVHAGQPLCILAHGSGNDMNSPFLATISQHIEQRSINVVRFNFPYKTAARKAPDRSEILENSWKLVIDWVDQNLEHRGLFIGGKSMGGRIATMIAKDVSHLKGLIFLGFPLHAPGKFDEVRDEYLINLQLPMLFIQGTRDPFARMDLLQNTLAGLRKWATLHWIEGGDHSFKVLIHPGKSYPEILQHVAHLVADWIAEAQPKE